MAVFSPNWPKEQMQSQMKVQQTLRVKFGQVYYKTYVTSKRQKKKKKEAQIYWRKRTVVPWRSLWSLRHLHFQYLDVCFLLLGCFNLIPWQLFLKFWHPTFTVISSPSQTSYFSMDPSCLHLAYSVSMSILRCSVYCSVSRPCYSIQHKAGSPRPSLSLSLQIDR